MFNAYINLVIKNQLLVAVQSQLRNEEVNQFVQYLQLKV